MFIGSLFSCSPLLFVIQELTNAYEKIMEQRRGSDEKCSKAGAKSKSELEEKEKRR